MAKADSVHTIPNLRTAIARIEKIAAEAGDHLLLGDGPPHPDAKLLDLCGEVLHHLTKAENAQKERRSEWTGEVLARDHELFQIYQDGTKRATPPLRLVAKTKAVTTAGIYAKALVVRCSRTGAAVLAMSLAEDLVSNPALRTALWGAQPEGACAPPVNVVALPLRTAGRA